ncbi:tetratricopeptide repeat protein [Aurantimonas sp. A2-1-M11]|uniref:tetratricopeptide repeat protein n=1 Tax=Aurantimonas sp. A2-1-M11 TaxID=3113712 RepID=UPI002F945EAD
MSDESFFREVSEELRQDRVKAIWTRFGTYILAAVVLVVVTTIAVVGWDRYQTAQANASGDAYLAALQLARDGQPDAAVTALDAIAADGYGAYPDLARMSIGGVYQAQGKPDEAVAAFDRVSADAGAPDALRDMAAVRAAYILVDHGSLSDVRSRVERLTGDSEALRFPAREAVALAAWKAGDAETASTLFQQLVDDPGAPNGIISRARLMLDLVAAGKPAPEGTVMPAEAGVAESPQTDAPADAAAPVTSPEPAAAASDAGPAASGAPAPAPAESTAPAAEVPAAAPQGAEQETRATSGAASGDAATEGAAMPPGVVAPTIAVPTTGLGMTEPAEEAETDAAAPEVETTTPVAPQGAPQAPAPASAD